MKIQRVFSFILLASISSSCAVPPPKKAEAAEPAPSAAASTSAASAAPAAAASAKPVETSASAPLNTNAIAAAASTATAGPHTNTAIIPIQRPEPRAQRRSDTVLKRAKDNPGPCDIAFIGDSITEGWEAAAAKPVWDKAYGALKTLNFGVGGDRTQHVLWRFDRGQLDGIEPKVAVVLIGTNNSNKDDNTEADILEGVKLVLHRIREKLPTTKIILMAIFPRGQTFSVQRGKILQVNEALAKMDDGQTLRYVDIGPQLIEEDGSISKATMRDYLHLTEHGYQIWADAIQPILDGWLK